ncbi:heme-dependent oxidative N-demethylase family protein [Primorskyibacter sp. 2E233]|uniref:heme-dependent oxidative N-demethylase family protein n=1 Tax=Primorskyibacter sp. 2E233 TaxID=3413431 RepID=UPI003BF13BEB
MGLAERAALDHAAAMILNNTIPHDPLAPRPLPGITPVGPEGWLQINDAYAGQLAEKARLLSEARGKVLWLDPQAQPVAEELLSEVLKALPQGFARDGDTVLCPDGRRVQPDWSDPLGTLGHLVQEDFCLLVKEGDEHVLRGALLCFPASWMLAEKAGRPLIGIHDPVASYDASIAKRVQRLFDGIQVGRPLWRFNALWYAEPDLFHPRGSSDRRIPVDPASAPYMRSERQSLIRLPVSGAVVFSIHTYVLARASLSAGRDPA